MDEELTQVEKAWLLILYSEGYRYIARDNDGELYAYKYMPDWRKECYWSNGNKDNNYYAVENDELFSSIVYKGVGPFKIICNAPIDYFDLEEV